MNLSFAWTWPAFASQAKTCTRRTWSPAYAQRWGVGPGPEFTAIRDRWHASPALGTGRVVSVAYEYLTDMPDEDYTAEGFSWLHAHPELIPPAGRRMFGTCTFAEFAAWRAEGGSVYVVRFEPLTISAWAAEAIGTVPPSLLGAGESGHTPA